MQFAFAILLIGALGAAVGSFAVLGLRRHLRTAALARRAHELSLHFSPEDSFDVPRRYAAFALVGCGHSPRADNCTYGRMRGLPVRAFEFRYEAGHGTGRQTRAYGLAVVETEADLEPVLMWNQYDLAGAPMAARLGDGHCRAWVFRGRQEAADRLADCCLHLADTGLSIEVRPGAVMFCFPLRRRGYMDRLADLPRLIDGLALAPPACREPAGAGQNGGPGAVETATPS